MTDDLRSIPTGKFRDLSTYPVLSVDMASMGMTLADALEPDAFAAKPTPLQVGSLVRLIGLDGRCWATVTGVSERGGLIIEADVLPGAASSPKRGRPPKVAEAA